MTAKVSPCVSGAVKLSFTFDDPATVSGKQIRGPSVIPPRMVFLCLAALAVSSHGSFYAEFGNPDSADANKISLSISGKNSD